MKLLAGIVLYNPDKNRLDDNISAIVHQVDEILLVDNGSDYTLSGEEVESYGNNIKYIRNQKNHGIAYGLNQILNYSKDNGYEWFVTLDQDSVVADQLLEVYLQYISDDVGQLTCNIIDRNVGAIDKTKYKSSVAEVDYCITSGCLNNTKALILCGGYDESLFIDGVDLDISCKLRNKGYKILSVDYDGLLHQLGEGKKFEILWLRLSVANHVPWRNYYTRRNMIYVARKYYKGMPKLKLILKQIAYGVGAVLLENQKIERIKKNYSGIRDGLRK